MGRCRCVFPFLNIHSDQPITYTIPYRSWQRLREETLPAHKRAQTTRPGELQLERGRHVKASMVCTSAYLFIFSGGRYSSPFGHYWDVFLLYLLWQSTCAFIALGLFGGFAFYFRIPITITPMSFLSDVATSRNLHARYMRHHLVHHHAYTYTHTPRISVYLLPLSHSKSAYILHINIAPNMHPNPTQPTRPSSSTKPPISLHRSITEHAYVSPRPRLHNSNSKPRPDSRLQDSTTRNPTCHFSPIGTSRLVPQESSSVSPYGHGFRSLPEVFVSILNSVAEEDEERG